MLKGVIEGLRKNNMRAYAVDTSAQARELVSRLLPVGALIACGGSVTLAQTKVLDLIRSGEYEFIDRYRPGISREEAEEAFRRSFFCDYYFTSANAITEDGVLFNVDGNSNRVAAILYGPKNVIVVAGKNKIVKNLDEASMRVRTVAAPLNCKRLGCGTFCAEAGRCVCADTDEHEYSDGCASDARICCNYVISAKQRQKDRITVILVNETLGY